MRWTATEAERATAELTLGMRIAGVGELLGRLVGLGEIAEPSAWCVGLIDGRAALLLAGADRIELLRAAPHAHADRVPDVDEPDVLTSRLADITELRINPAFEGFALHIAGRPPLDVRSVPRLQLPAFVAHLISFIPSATSPLSTPPTSPTTPGVNS